MTHLIEITRIGGGDVIRTASAVGTKLAIEKAVQDNINRKSEGIE